jgi:Lon protease-like protein
VSTAPAAPRVLPIFPLPDVTLFPHTTLPLHVFEARYRAMVTDALSRDRRLAVVMLKPGYESHYEGKPAVQAVAGAGEIVKWERLPTGRYNMLVQGRWRIRIVRELPTDTLYRMVQVDLLEEVPGAADVAPLLRRVRETCGTVLAALDRPRDLLDAALGGDPEPGVVADRVAASFLPDPAVRQELLETTDVGRRLARLAAALEALANELKGPGSGG